MRKRVFCGVFVSLTYLKHKCVHLLANLQICQRPLVDARLQQNVQKGLLALRAQHLVAGQPIVDRRVVALQFGSSLANDVVREAVQDFQGAVHLAAQRRELEEGVHAQHKVEHAQVHDVRHSANWSQSSVCLRMEYVTYSLTAST